MSLSSNIDSERTQVGEYKIYCLQSFEAESEGDNHIEEASIFQTFFDENECVGEKFRCEPSDGRDQAEIIISQAKREAEYILNEAKKNIANIEEEAYEKGYKQGEKDGYELGAKKLDKKLEQINELFKEMINCRSDFTRQYEKETLDLICRIAEKVVRSKIETDQSVVRENIFEAFNLAAEKTDIKMRVNPGDIEYVKELRPKFFERIAELKTITIESDPSVGLGGCVMETKYGHVDAQVETQLEKIFSAARKSFLEQLSENPLENGK